jgi:hypothetical protein
METQENNNMFDSSFFLVFSQKCKNGWITVKNKFSSNKELVSFNDVNGAIDKINELNLNYNNLLKTIDNLNQKIENIENNIEIINNNRNEQKILSSNIDLIKYDMVILNKIIQDSITTTNENKKNIEDINVKLTSINDNIIMLD